MSKILDQIKSNSVPAGVVHSAAKGALPLPAAEMLEILVYLTHNPVFAQEAGMTLARWDAESAIPVLSDPAAPAEVLSYFWMENNRRQSLMPSLIENPAISETMLMELAAEGRREMVNLLLSSKRARGSRLVMEALAVNPAVMPEELQALQSESPGQEAPQAEASAEAEADPETHAAHEAWQREHAEEIASEEGKPFELTGSDEEHEHEPGRQAVSENDVNRNEDTGQAAVAPTGSSAELGAQPPSAAESSAVSTASPVLSSSTSGTSGAALAAAALGFQSRAQAAQEEKKQLTVLQRISRMNAAERVKAAFTGGREERSILIRDGAKVVQMAVLASPKLTDPEVETFAAAKNVSESVLREIARTRRFMKNYNVGRNLVNNAKCPLDLSLTLIKNLMIYDLKSLRFNKAVPETIRNVAAKLYREKSGPSKEAKRGG